MSTNRLAKDAKNSVWDGVLAGIANSLDFDPAIVRFVYCVLTIVSGIVPGIFLYFIMSVCMPYAKIKE